MKVALAFWGLTRSLKYTIKSIKKNILNELIKNNIDYHIFIHTYSINTPYSNERSHEKNIILNNNEYKLLNPYFCHVDSHEHIKKKLHLNKYRTHKDPWNSNYKTVDNFIIVSDEFKRCRHYLIGKKLIVSGMRIFWPKYFIQDLNTFFLVKLI